ncbi:MAG: hypothetical protein ACP5U2_02890 [Bryobacteraceae bacterium]
MSKRDWWLAGEALLLLGLGSALFIALDVPSAYARWRAQQRQIQELERGNIELRREIRMRLHRLRQLEEDPGELELYLRQHQKRVRPGERVFLLPPDKPR